MSPKVLERPKSKHLPRAVSHVKLTAAPLEYCLVSNQKIPLRLGVYMHDQKLYLNGLLKYANSRIQLVSCALRHRVHRHTLLINVLWSPRQPESLESLVRQYFPDSNWVFLEVRYALPVHKINSEFN